MKLHEAGEIESLATMPRYQDVRRARKRFDEASRCLKLAAEFTSEAAVRSHGSVDLSPQRARLGMLHSNLLLQLPQKPRQPTRLQVQRHESKCVLKSLRRSGRVRQRRSCRRSRQNWPKPNRRRRELSGSTRDTGPNRKKRISSSRGRRRSFSALPR